MTRDYLVFTLSATLGAMGELAGHERRSSWTWPGRSAVLGLCAAALGIRRTGDFSQLDTLRMAVGVYSSGTPLRDFHTIQTVPSVAARNPQSRGQALRHGRARLETTITLRDYQAGCLFGVALWARSGESLLPALRQALQQPVFTLYLGRKSCPLNSPVAPVLLQSTDATSALQAAVKIPEWAGTQNLQQIWTEEPGPTGAFVIRHDQPLDRTAWHFAPRQMRRIDAPANGGPLHG
ncbi:type I-E CRISPR-associated protein Cas5/CasD [Pseudogemmobacter faecipullorum]|uniref:Type I-E CRISPR-associated protein Cas5/CasD n=1 Tax=Pseudogemmobacter faecipullorum TaxID=2755041 RepID=A0ABS8CS19_9RHOB|nr:type I-E CRISPR-associated protein Cas5/CasD [Pseudogemmobacter faecipullorum]